MTVAPWPDFDRFYFQEFVAKLHPSLQRLATDRLILVHTPDLAPITTVQGLYPAWYTDIPWLLNDIFALQEDLLLQVGQAWILTTIKFVMIDNIVDQHTPAIPTISLLIQNIHLAIIRLWRDILPHSTTFWRRYDDTFRLLWDALAHETYCVDQHAQPYTYQEIQRVNQGKAGPMQLLVYALAELSDRLDYVQPLQALYTHMTLADQLLDDAYDWPEDLDRGRLTFPLVMALEAENIPFAQASDMGPADFKAFMVKHDIRKHVAQRACDLFDEVLRGLEAINSTQTYIGQAMLARRETAQKTVSRYQGLRFLDFLATALSP